MRYLGPVAHKFIAIALPHTAFCRIGIVSLLAVAFLFSSSAAAQDELDTAPPPIKAISKEEQKRLDDTKDPRDRLQTAIMLMERRLSNAQTELDARSYLKMNDELGAYHGLLDGTLTRLIREADGRKSSFENLKRFEAAIRPQILKLELIRRSAPIEYEPYLRKLIKVAQDSRGKALEPMFSDDVVPNMRPTQRP